MTGQIPKYTATIYEPDQPRPRGNTNAWKSWTGDPCPECGLLHAAWVHEPETQGNTGDHDGWTGDPCKICGKGHQSWVHDPPTPVQLARRELGEQAKRTAHVNMNPRKYGKDKVERSDILLEMRRAKYDVVIAEAKVARLRRKAEKHSEQLRDAEAEGNDAEIAKFKKRLANSNREIAVAAEEVKFTIECVESLLRAISALDAIINLKEETS